MTSPPSAELAKQSPFVAELARLRNEAGHSQGKLGEMMGYDRTYVNKVERGSAEPTEQFARRADKTLRTSGQLLRLWQERESARTHASERNRRSDITPVAEASADLLVDHDEAWLRWTPEHVHLHMHKALVNIGDVPITRYFMRIAVDRFPNDRQRSNEYHRRHPLTMDEVYLDAHCGNEPMLWEIAADRDASKEIWLLFRNREGQFPLYPGQSCEVDYAFRVATAKWGDWFQRSVRLPARRVSVHLQFPATFRPSVWGIETSPVAGQRPFDRPIESTEVDGEVFFNWSTPRPHVSARYRLEWKFQTLKQENAP